MTYQAKRIWTLGLLMVWSGIALPSNIDRERRHDLLLRALVAIERWPECAKEVLERRIERVDDPAGKARLRSALPSVDKVYARGTFADPMKNSDQAQGV